MVAVVIGHHDEPAGRLDPSAPAERVRDCTGRVLLACLHTHSLPAHLQRSPQEIEAMIDDERAAWD